MQRLVGQIKNYAWGSHLLLSGLRGESASTEPEAEVWFGGHESAPSTFADGSTLLNAIQEDPVGQLGSAAAARFGAELPFLVKLLASDAPLSIQAHPNREQAIAGFAIEEAAGIGRSAPERNFRDQNPKPELICAITDFEALVGFRPVADTEQFFNDIGFVDVLASLMADGPKAVVARLLDPQRDVQQSVAVVDALVGRCREYRNDGWAAEAAMLLRLNESYPGDPGVVVAALLNYVLLEPGESLFLEAGGLHAYLGGLALEVMANSDNVLRGGLTEKHIDVSVLLDIVSPTSQYPTRVLLDANGDLIAPADEFAVRRHDNPQDSTVSGPQLIAGVSGEISVSSPADGGAVEIIGPAEAVWVRYGEEVTLSGKGLCFSTTVGAVDRLRAG